MNYKVLFILTSIIEGFVSGETVVDNGSCSLPVVPPQTRYTISAGIGPSVDQFTRLDFKCLPGFLMIGFNRSHCIEGKWTPNTPKCSRTCKPLKSISLEYECSYDGVNIPCNSPMVTGSKATVICKENFKPTGLKIDTIMCKTDGLWQESYVTCSPECGTSSKLSENEILPWHATIYERIDGISKSICAGSIVNSATILTAAHCFCTETAVKNIDAFGVKLSGYYKNVDKIFKVKRFVVHPSYFGPDSDNKQDIALVVLTNIINYTSHIKPICLNWDQSDGDTSIKVGTYLQVSGDLRDKNITANKLNVRVIDKEDCRDVSPRNIKKFITRDKFCTEFVNDGKGFLGENTEGGAIFSSKRSWSSREFYIKGVVTHEANKSTLISTSTAQYMDFLRYNGVHRNIEPFLCNSGEEINEEDICDGISDCIDGSDEDYEFCISMMMNVPRFESEIRLSDSQTSRTSEPLAMHVESTTAISMPINLSMNEVAESLESTTGDEDLNNGDSSETNRCILPPFPNHGSYGIRDSVKVPVPGEMLDSFLSIDFMCDYPYVIHGYDSSICLIDTWSPDIPICVNSVRTGEEKLIPEDCSMVKSNISGVYTIWPLLTVEPFSVYCDFDYLNSKWTVLQRRFDGSVNFSRSFEEYVKGFGDLGGEHWLGLSKIYDITKNKDYELYVLLTDFDNQTRFAKYIDFFIGLPNHYDHTIGTYMGTAGDALINSIGYTFCTYDDVQDCNIALETGWWLNAGTNISNLNGPYIIEPFSRNFSGVTWSTWHRNSSLKSTTMMVRKLTDNYNVTSGLKVIYPEDCADVDSSISGVYIIQPPGSPQAFSVYCEISANNRWTVIQKRFEDVVFFYQKYAEYQFGFGDLNREHWLGLERIYQLTRNSNYELAIELMDYENVTKIARYGEFSVSSVEDGYRLKVAQYRGTAGDSLTSHDGYGFSTSDHDVDDYDGNCAEEYIGAWWYHNCYNSHLNGVNSSVVWSEWHGLDYPLKSTKMSIRRKSIR